MPHSFPSCEGHWYQAYFHLFSSFHARTYHKRALELFGVPWVNKLHFLFSRDEIFGEMMYISHVRDCAAAIQHWFAFASKYLKSEWYILQCFKRRTPHLTNILLISYSILLISVVCGAFSRAREKENHKRSGNEVVVRDRSFYKRWEGGEGGGEGEGGLRHKKWFWGRRPAKVKIACRALL